MKRIITLAGLASVLFFFTPLSLAQDTGLPPEDDPERSDPELPYSPYATGSAPTQVYWGDTHLPTSYSMDAGAFGARLPNTGNCAVIGAVRSAGQPRSGTGEGDRPQSARGLGPHARRGDPGHPFNGYRLVSNFPSGPWSGRGDRGTPITWVDHCSGIWPAGRSQYPRRHQPLSRRRFGAP